MPERTRQPLVDGGNQANHQATASYASTGHHKTQYGNASTASPRYHNQQQQQVSAYQSQAHRERYPQNQQPYRQGNTQRTPRQQRSRQSRQGPPAANSSDIDYLAKTRIGPWVLGKTKLGEGSAGYVQLCRHSTTNQVAAVKIVAKTKLRQNQAGSLAALDQWDMNQPRNLNGEMRVPVVIEREVAILKLLQHRHIMALHDIWENRMGIYLVLEYIDGGDLFRFIQNQGPLPEPKAVHFFRQIMSAMTYLHAFDICHRDLKPENIMMTKSGLIKICDFGMAALHQTTSHRLDTACGSPHYVAPEVLNQRPYRGDMTDIWSMGVIFFAMLAARLPFDFDDLQVMMDAARRADYTMPSGLSKDSQHLIRRILTVDPAQRITMDQMWRHPLIRQYAYLDDLREHDGQPNGPQRQFKYAPVPPEELDPQLVRQLRVLWHRFNDEQLSQQLISPENNPQKVFYWLLHEYSESHYKQYSPGLVNSQSEYHHMQPGAWKRNRANNHRHKQTISISSHGSATSTSTVGSLPKSTNGGATATRYRQHVRKSTLERNEVKEEVLVASSHPQGQTEGKKIGATSKQAKELDAKTQQDRAVPPSDSSLTAHLKSGMKRVSTCEFSFGKNGRTISRFTVVSNVHDNDDGPVHNVNGVLSTGDEDPMDIDEPEEIINHQTDTSALSHHSSNNKHNSNNQKRNSASYQVRSSPSDITEDEEDSSSIIRHRQSRHHVDDPHGTEVEATTYSHRSSSSRKSGTVDEGDHDDEYTEEDISDAATITSYDPYNANRVKPSQLQVDASHAKITVHRPYRPSPSQGSMLSISPSAAMLLANGRSPRGKIGPNGQYIRSASSKLRRKVDFSHLRRGSSNNLLAPPPTTPSRGGQGSHGSSSHQDHTYRHSQNPHPHHNHDREQAGEEGYYHSEEDCERDGVKAAAAFYYGERNETGGYRTSPDRVTITSPSGSPRRNSPQYASDQKRRPTGNESLPHVPPMPADVENLAHVPPQSRVSRSSAGDPNYYRPSSSSGVPRGGQGRMQAPRYGGYGTPDGAHLSLEAHNRPRSANPTNHYQPSHPHYAIGDRPQTASGALEMSPPRYHHPHASYYQPHGGIPPPHHPTQNGSSYGPSRSQARNNKNRNTVPNRGGIIRSPIKSHRNSYSPAARTAALHGASVASAGGSGAGNIGSAAGPVGGSGELKSPRKRPRPGQALQSVAKGQTAFKPVIFKKQSDRLQEEELRKFSDKIAKHLDHVFSNSYGSDSSIATSEAEARPEDASPLSLSFETDPTTVSSSGSLAQRPLPPVPKGTHASNETPATAATLSGNPTSYDDTSLMSPVSVSSNIVVHSVSPVKGPGQPGGHRPSVGAMSGNPHKTWRGGAMLGHSRLAEFNAMGGGGLPLTPIDEDHDLQSRSDTSMGQISTSSRVKPRHQTKESQSSEAGKEKRGLEYLSQAENTIRVVDSPSRPAIPQQGQPNRPQTQYYGRQSAVPQPQRHYSSGGVEEQQRHLSIHDDPLAPAPLNIQDKRPSTRGSSIFNEPHMQLLENDLPPAIRKLSETQEQTKSSGNGDRKSTAARSVSAASTSTVHEANAQSEAAKAANQAEEKQKKKRSVGWFRRGSKNVSESSDSVGTASNQNPSASTSAASQVTTHQANGRDEGESKAKKTLSRLFLRKSRLDPIRRNSADSTSGAVSPALESPGSEASSIRSTKDNKKTTATGTDGNGQGQSQGQGRLPAHHGTLQDISRICRTTDSPMLPPLSVLGRSDYQARVFEQRSRGHSTALPTAEDRFHSTGSSQTVTTTSSSSSSAFYAEDGSFSGPGNNQKPHLDSQQGFFARLFRVGQAVDHLCLEKPQDVTLQLFGRLFYEWRAHGLREIHINPSLHMITARVDAVNTLDVKPVSFSVEIMHVIEHVINTDSKAGRGKKGPASVEKPLSLVQLKQLSGSTNSFHRVANVLRSALERKEILITNRRRAKMMIRTYMS